MASSTASVAAGPVEEKSVVPDNITASSIVLFIGSRFGEIT
jgi:hypothetical protein